MTQVSLIKKKQGIQPVQTVPVQGGSGGLQRAGNRLLFLSPSPFFASFQRVHTWHAMIVHRRRTVAPAPAALLHTLLHTLSDTLLQLCCSSVAALTWCTGDALWPQCRSVRPPALVA